MNYAAVNERLAALRRALERNEAAVKDDDGDMVASGHFDYIGRGSTHVVVHRAKKPKDGEKSHRAKLKRIADLVTK